VGAGGIAVRVLHLDHVGAEVAEHRCGQRACVDGSGVDDARSRQRAGAGFLGFQFGVVDGGHGNSFV
jgi:hypothetical protein